MTHTVRTMRPVLGAALAATLLFGSAVAGDLENAARQYVAAQHGVSADALRVASVEDGALPLSGAQFAGFKFYTADGGIYGATIDKVTGRPVAHSDLVAAEAELRLKKFGSIDPALFGRMGSDPSARIPIAVWLRHEDIAKAGRGHDGKAPDFAAVQSRMDDAVTPAAEHARGLGAIVHRADLAPFFLAELNAGQIRALSKRGDVVAIQEVPKDLRRLNDDSATSDRFAFIWSSADGTGAKVAVHEDDGVALNQYLHSAARPVTYWNPGTPNVQSHATAVAGVIASTHPWRRGGAYGTSEILSANFQSFSSYTNMINSAAWAVRMGADTINMSWGGPSSGGQTFWTAWVDYLVKNFGVNIVVSSGNDFPPSFVMSPSLGWNTISVGAYFDNNTGLQSDDAISTFSDYKNPLDPVSGFGYEKPDVTGMGGQYNPATGACYGSESTDLSNGVSYSACGTSFSAPDVAAVTSLVLGEQPALRGKAEAMKAVVMAGATHNIVDGIGYLDCASSPTLNDCRDGAGAINAYQAVKNVATASTGNWRWMYLTPASFPGDYIEYSVYIAKNKGVRVALAWDSTAVCGSLGTGASSCSSDVLNADLDLYLLSPSGSLVAWSASYAGSAEVIDYKTTVAGTYTIVISPFRFDAGTDTYAGIAWNLSTSDTLTAATGLTSVTLGTPKTGQTTDKGRSYWDNYAMAPGVPDPTGCVSFLGSETGLEKLYKVTTSSTGKITATLSAMSPVPGADDDMDVVILRKTGSADLQNKQMLGCGNTTASVSQQPPGTYYIVVDGYGGSVANYTLTATFQAGQSMEATPEVLPVRAVPLTELSGE